MIDGEGVKQGPDLTRAGEKRDAKWLREWIAIPRRSTIWPTCRRSTIG